MRRSCDVAGAVFGQAAGWERANWFEPGDPSTPRSTYSFDRAVVVRPRCGVEFRATREAVALYDLSTYSKFLVQGPGALAGCSACARPNVDVPVGRSCTRVLCNERAASRWTRP